MQHFVYVSLFVYFHQIGNLHPQQKSFGNNDSTHEAGSLKLMPTIGYGTCCRPGAKGEDSDSPTNLKGGRIPPFVFISHLQVDP